MFKSTYGWPARLARRLVVRLSVVYFFARPGPNPGSETPTGGFLQPGDRPMAAGLRAETGVEEPLELVCVCVADGRLSPDGEQSQSCSRFVAAM